VGYDKTGVLTKICPPSSGSPH